MTKNREKKKAPEKAEKTYPVQDLVHVKRIYRGMVITSDNRYVRAMEVLPINYQLRSADEQKKIIHAFAGIFKNDGPVRFQFKIITRRADTHRILNNFSRTMAGEKNRQRLALGRNYMEFIRAQSATEALTRRYFLIFEYAPKARKKGSTLDDIADIMDSYSRMITDCLQNSSCKNEVVIPEPKDRDYFQAEILYQFYNCSSAFHEDLAERVARVTRDNMLFQGLDPDKDKMPEVSIRDYIAPRGISFTSPDYFICDGMYKSIFMISRNGYREAVTGGWTSLLFNLGDGFDVDMVLHKEPRLHSKQKLSYSLKMSRNKLYTRAESSQDFEEVAGSKDAAGYLKSCLANKEDLFHIYTFITVSASGLEALTEKQEYLENRLASDDIGLYQVRYRLEDAFLATAPLLSFRPSLMQHGKRNLATMGAASIYPFTSSEICDDCGIVLGINLMSRTLVNLDVFNTRKYKNANITICGSSGTGKTYSIAMMSLRLSMMGTQVFILAPEKAEEYERACGHIGGSYISINPDSYSCINIMEIRPTLDPSKDVMSDPSVRGPRSWLAQKAASLRTFFRLLIPDITLEEEQLVDECIIKTYNMFSITHNNSSLYQDDGSIRPMPIIGDLYDIMESDPELRRVRNILGRFVVGSARSFNQQTNVDLNNRYIVFDVSDMRDLVSIGMYIVMDFVWSKVKMSHTQRKAIMCDEGWKVIGTGTCASVAEEVVKISKTCRAYNTSFVFATQEINDLYAYENGKYGKAIINNSKIKIILQAEHEDSVRIKQVLNLTEKERETIESFENRGDALICINSNKVPINIKASSLEHQLITTDPNDLQTIYLNREQTAKMEAAAAAKRSSVQSAMKNNQAGSYGIKEE